MQSSARSSTPHLVDIGRKDSTTSIQIDQEVSVVSSRIDDPKENGRKATYSTMPSLTDGHSRPQTMKGATTATISAPRLNRWNSDSRMSSNSRTSSRQRPQHKHVRQVSRDADLLESNRESMKALSDFLRTKDPPPDNFMSRHDSDAGSLTSMRKSVFNVFGRQKSKKSKAPKLLQLPDSAVAGKTRDGFRHIAISIPIEYDHLENGPSFDALHARPQSQPTKLLSERPGAVTILKPVKELRESGSSFQTSAPQNIDEKRESRNSQTESVTTPAAELLGPETARTLANYYTQLNRQQQKQTARADSAPPPKPGDPSRTQKSYVAVSPVDIMRQNSQRSDPRHSGGTVYSTTSIATQQGHSRGVSSVSTAPSVSTMKLELPPRKSSMSKVPRSLEAELAQTYNSVNRPSRDTTPRVSVQAEKTEIATPGVSVESEKAESLNSGTSISQSPPIVYGTAETAQGYSSVGVEHIRGHTPKIPSPAPTRRLPDVPESPLVPDFMPRPSPPPSEKKILATATPSQIAGKQSISVRNGPEGTARQSRQERVKARKARDIAAIREKGNIRVPLSDISREPSQSIRPSTAPSNPKRLSTPSQERLRRRSKNTISSVMLVADLAPYTDLADLSDLFLPPLPSNVASKRKNASKSNSNSNLSAKGTHTPPHSFTSSGGSDSELPRPDRSQAGSPRSVRSELNTRRQERRSKRNMTLREKEFESRLNRIERDNAILMNTLGGIATSFGDLRKMLPSRERRREVGLVEDSPTEAESVVRRPKQVRSLEPVMRELQGFAGRVSSEERRGDFDDFDEDDGRSIL